MAGRPCDDAGATTEELDEATDGRTSLDELEVAFEVELVAALEGVEVELAMVVACGV